MSEKGSSKSFSYRERKYSRRGVRALVMALVSIALLIALTALSRFGISSRITGAVGFTAFMIALMGIIEGLSSFHDVYVKSYSVSKLGTVLSGLIFALWFVIYCIGLSL